MARVESPDNPRAGTPGTQSPQKLARHLEGIDLEWPATKEELLEKARGNAAPSEVVEAIARLEGKRFESLDEVLLAYESQWPERGTGHGQPVS